MKQDIKVSYAKKIVFAKYLQTKSLTEIFDEIKSDKHKEVCLKLRTIKDKALRKQIKAENLPYFIPAGTFTQRNNNSLIYASGIACLDIDDYLQDNKQNPIKNNKYCFSCFLSPSNGLKVLVKIPKVSNNEEYQQYYFALLKYFNIKDIDETTISISQACYLSYDPCLVINWDSEVFTLKEDVKPIVEPKNIISSNTTNDRSSFDFGLICSLLRDKKQDEDIYRIMAKHGSDKWNSRDDYKIKTLQNAKKSVGGDISG